MKIIPLARKARDLVRGRELQEKRTHRFSRWVTLAVVFVLMVLITSPSLWDKPLVTAEGAAIDEPIVALASFQYLPKEAIQEWNRKRNLEYPRVFVYNSAVKENGIDRIQAIIDKAYALNDGPSKDAAIWRDELAAIDPQLENWSLPEVAQLVRLCNDERFRKGMIQVLEELYGEDYIALTIDRNRYELHQNHAVVRSNQHQPEPDARFLDFPDETTSSLATLIDRRLELPIIDDWRYSLVDVQGEIKGVNVLETPGAKVAQRLLKLGVSPNFAYDEGASAAERENFPEPKPQQFAKGDVLVPLIMASGEETAASMRWPHTLTPKESELLAAYDHVLQGVNLMKFLAQVLFVMIAFLIVSFFVIKFSRELEFNTNTVLLLGLPVLLALGLGRLFLILAGDTVGYTGYAFPAGVIGILGVLLLDVRLAILMVTWGCLLFGLEANLEYEYVIVGLFGGYTAVAALYTFRERREVLYAGLLIGFVNAATILILHFISDSTREVWSAAAIGALSGIMCSLISFAVLPVFEVAFHITTDMRLLELCGLQHPLLKRMEEVAPGTLQHTMNVTKLAESAASAIGINYLLVRAGCYFHDIGKMSKPEYFTENQMTPEDKRRHNELKPQMSTLIIRNHVKEGLELAKEYNLPKVVVDFIPEHHGTSLIQYFYHKALTAQEHGEAKEPVREEDYRYPGPRPQSIEAAVVMLADTVEATATAKLSGRTVREDDIQMLVRNAIFEKFNDGQFDDCNLTMRDLNTIRESFVKTLRSRFHSRIDYPSAKKEMSKKEKREAREKQATTTDEETGTPNPDRDIAAAS